MMFGGAHWILWVVFGIFVAGCAGTCGLGWWGYRRWRGFRRCEGAPERDRLDAAPTSSGSRSLRPATAESHLKALQKQFVDGHLTIEQYERALDRLGTAS